MSALALPTLEEMLDQAEAQARRVMVGTREGLTPVFLMVNGRGVGGVVAAPYSSAEEKNLALEAVRKLMRDFGCVRYSFLSEAWTAHVRSADDVDPPPSQRPDRIETVVALATDGRNSVYRMWRTQRTPDGTCAGLELDPPCDDWAGRFENLMGAVH